MAFDYVEDGDFDTPIEDLALGMATAIAIPTNLTSQLEGYVQNVFTAMDAYAEQGNYDIRMVIMKWRYADREWTLDRTTKVGAPLLPTIQSGLLTWRGATE